MDQGIILLFGAFFFFIFSALGDAVSVRDFTGKRIRKPERKLPCMLVSSNL